MPLHLKPEINTPLPPTTRVIETGLRQRIPWFALARVAWLVIFGMCLGVFIGMFPYQFRNSYWNGQMESSLAVLGYSILRRSLTRYILAIQYLAVLVFIATALLIFLKRVLPRGSKAWMEWFVSLTLLCLIFLFNGEVNVELYPPPWGDVLAFVHFLLSSLGVVCLIILFFVFPDGHFVPRWMRWVLATFFVAILGFLWMESSGVVGEAAWPVLVVELFLLALTGLCVQIYRYRAVSTPVQRQQTKWIVFALALQPVWLIIATLGFIASIPRLASLFSLLSLHLQILLPTLIPLAIGVSILRFHLWDIDLLVRRTLVYGALTVTLALAYLACVVLLQSLFNLLTDQNQSELVTVLSTLAIAALFVPLRRRIQQGIDRRFYRRKYDAEKALAAFSAALRDEVDLNLIAEDLLAIVEETMQPESVSLWIRKIESR